MIDRMRWPFPDERAFWRWAYDPDAELDDYDEDLLLRHPDGLPLLAAAAADRLCPKRDYCANVLADYTCAIIRWERTDLYPPLRAAAAYAATLPDERIRDWSAHVERLFAYQQLTGPINRATAERMAADLLGGPIDQARAVAAGHANWITVHVTADGKHWECSSGTGRLDTVVVQIDRRTGQVRFTRRGSYT